MFKIGDYIKDKNREVLNALVLDILNENIMRIRILEHKNKIWEGQNVIVINNIDKFVHYNEQEYISSQSYGIPEKICPYKYDTITKYIDEDKKTVEYSENIYHKCIGENCALYINGKCCHK